MRLNRAGHRQINDSYPSGGEDIKQYLDKIQLMKAFAFLTERRINQSDIRSIVAPWNSIFEALDNFRIKTRTLIEVSLAISAQDHVRDPQSEHVRLLLDTDQMTLPNLVPKCRVDTCLSIHHRHRGNQEPTGTCASIYDYIRRANVCNLREEFGQMAGGYNDAKALLITAGIP